MNLKVRMLEQRRTKWDYQGRTSEQSCCLQRVKTVMEEQQHPHLVVRLCWRGLRMQFHSNSQMDEAEMTLHHYPQFQTPVHSPLWVCGRRRGGNTENMQGKGRAVSQYNESLQVGVREEEGCAFHTNTRSLYNEDVQENYALFNVQSLNVTVKSFPNPFPIFFPFPLQVISNRSYIFPVFPLCTLHLRMLSLTSPPSMSTHSLGLKPNTTSLSSFLQFPQLDPLSVLRQNPVLLPFITKSHLISISREFLTPLPVIRSSKARSMPSLAHICHYVLAQHMFNKCQLD